MLIKLTKDQVANYWPLIKSSFDTVELPISKGDKNKRDRKLLRGILVGEYECWALTRQHTDDRTSELHGFALTGEMDDLAGFNCLTLMYYYRFPDSDFSAKEIVDCWKTFEEYAKGKGYDSIVAYTDNDGLVNLAKKMGANTEFRFIYWTL